MAGCAVAAGELALDGGFHVGPLFVVKTKRAAKPRMQSTYRDRLLVKRIPAWASRAELRAIKMERQRLTRETGIQYSEDHIVPLNHPLVCGLHCPANLRIAPLSENMKKSNSWWPDMWGEQIPLL